MKRYRIELTIGDELLYQVHNIPARGPDQKIGQGHGMSLTEALEQIRRVLVDDAPFAVGATMPTARDFTPAERALLIYGLGLAARVADPDVLESTGGLLGLKIDREMLERGRCAGVSDSIPGIRCSLVRDHDGPCTS